MADYAPQIEARFYDQQIQALGQSALDLLAEALASYVEGAAKAHINGNNQIDTGFMANSVYTVAKSGSNYGNTWPDGEYEGIKGGGKSLHEKGPEQNLGGDTLAIVAVGADYAVYQENANSFLAAAVQDVQGALPGIVKAVKGELGL
jgi:hypothetical protein